MIRLLEGMPYDIRITLLLRLFNTLLNSVWFNTIMANNINSAQKMPSAGERIPLPLQLTSAQIKFNRQNNTPVGIADDLKAAASDCLKKCASMLGVAGDVYWRDLDQFPAG